MGIQEGIQDAVPVARDHAADQLVCILAVPGARPHIQLVRLGPSCAGRSDFTCGSSLITDLQRPDRSFHPLFRILVDQCTRIQADQLGSMPVERSLVRASARPEIRDTHFRQIPCLRFSGRSLFIPLFDLPFLSDDDRVELALGLFPLFSLVRIHAEFLGRVDRHIIQFPYKGLVIGCTVDSRTLLRGEGRPYDKTVLIIAPPQETIPEVGHFLQHRIDRIFQQLFILRIEILVIHVLHCPR